MTVFLLSISAYSQKLENVKIQQNKGELLVQYDLYGQTEVAYQIGILYSADNKTWKKAEKLHGDYGDSIMPGRNKQIVLWLDLFEGLNTKMYFKLIAVYPKVIPQKKGTLTDAIGNNYNWVRFGETQWMSENLKSTNDPSVCGTIYNYTAASNTCPDNWRLPTDEDWMNLEKHFGMSANKANEFGLRDVKSFKSFNDSGFVLNECKYRVSFYQNQVAAAFWSSSVNKLLYMGYSDKYITRIFRLNENKLSKEMREKTEELSVRCVKSAVFNDTISVESAITLNLSNTTGIVKDIYTGENFEWVKISNSIWFKKDIIGTFSYNETVDKCPAGWRLPNEKEWQDLFAYYKPSIKLENESQALSERVSSNGIWGFNMSQTDYWMGSRYYTYQTFWINRDNKEDSKKLMSYPTNKSNLAGWTNKQTNEKAKMRCVLDNEDYNEYSGVIETGKIIDSRDKKEYKTVSIDGKLWMAENLYFASGENSKCRDELKMNCEKFGYLYNITVTDNVCPDGWKIPSSADWEDITGKSANNLKVLYPFGKIGFDLLFGGEVIKDPSGKAINNVYTTKFLYKDGENAGYIFFDSNNKTEQVSKAKKKDLVYIRCIKK
ncbi:MAG: hypothetical protein A2W99_01890 [Bacteroidetes bacterium GWF2_33_16]|nr:MAG: hypothetical protein A2X00_16265 [Bacteroidetes bacterium GWE2_32_14]OFY07020.1 MAG: hypothetical protein A2W99_01890 [Bacteroidetes bacterium GWF2_33_16]